uniref:Uncharacterized protein n=1 Tax=Zonotrichia albicollis TaxID=44394 RepID=A0A8D2N9Z4_ZONAL
MTTEKSPAADADSSEQQQAKEEEGAAETQKQEASLEEGAQPTPERQPQRQKASNGETPTHEEQGKKERRASEGRGLSRLFSSFLRRPKSQVSEEDKDTDAPKEAGGDQKDAGLGASPDEDILVKAPIAAPEPELKTDPSLDLHSLSSAETQPVPGPHHPHGKNFLPISHLASVSLKQFPLAMPRASALEPHLCQWEHWGSCLGEKKPSQSRRCCH